MRLLNNWAGGTAEDVFRDFIQMSDNGEILMAPKKRQMLRVAVASLRTLEHAYSAWCQDPEEFNQND